MGSKNWNSQKLGDIIELKYGKSLKGYKENTSGVPVFGTNGPIGFTKEPLTKGPGIIIGRKGAYRGVHYTPVDFYVIDTAYYLLPKINELDLKWVYYALLSKDLNSLDSGSAIPSTRKEDFYALNVTVPPLSTQKNIAMFLSNIDEKIDINNKIISNLQQISQTLFKQWFIKFEFPNEEGQPYKSNGGEMIESNLGKIPKGWEIEIFSNIMSISSGKRPTIKEDKLSSECPIPIIGASKIMGYTSGSLYESPILIIGRVGTHGVVQKIVDSCWPSDNTLVIQSAYYNFVYEYLKIIDYKSLNRGSTQPLITQTDIKNQQLAFPKKLVLIELFENLLTPMLEKQFSLLKENKNLQQLRETLLPKLLSGELEIPEKLEV